MVSRMFWVLVSDARPPMLEVGHGLHDCSRPNIGGRALERTPLKQHCWRNKQNIWYLSFRWELLFKAYVSELCISVNELSSRLVGVLTLFLNKPRIMILKVPDCEREDLNIQTRFVS